MCGIASLNVLLLHFPTLETTVNDRNMAKQLLKVLCRISKRILSISKTDLALEAVISSLLFVRTLEPSQLVTWQAEFSGWKSLTPLLISNYEALLPMLLSTVRISCTANKNDYTGLLLIYDLVNYLLTLSHAESSCHFVRLITVGEPSLLSLITREAPVNLAASFTWLTIKLLVPIREKVPIASMRRLTEAYVRLREGSSDKQWAVGIMVEIGDQISDVFSGINSSEERFSSALEIKFVIDEFVAAATNCALGEWIA